MNLCDHRAAPTSTLARALDAVMEATVVPSFTRIGYQVRRRLFTWEELSQRSLEGRVMAITGATSGLGAETARTLGRMGATILLVVRDPAKADATLATFDPAARARARVYISDLSESASVRAAASEILEREPVLDVLIHNAGGITPVRTRTSDGHERTFATMVLGPFLLTRLLTPLLDRSDDARIVTVTSGGMYTQALRLDDLGSSRSYRGTAAYARAKRAQVVLTQLWAMRLRPNGIVAHAMHPGWADTPGVEASLPRFRRVIGPLLRTPAEGADTIVWLAAADEPRARSGLVWHDRAPRPFDRVRATRVSRDDAERLWRACEAMVGPDPR